MEIKKIIELAYRLAEESIYQIKSETKLEWLTKEEADILIGAFEKKVRESQIKK